ncbi:MAG: BON domain-containing protein [Myxococcales bacterium]|nr:BON domain-containing protein [Myxococcales bacterium]
MHRVSTSISEDPRTLIGPTGPILRATPPGNRRVHDQDDGLRATRDDPQGSRFQTQGPIRNEGVFPDADASYDGYGAYAALDGSRVDNAEFADLDYTGPLLDTPNLTAPRDDEDILTDVMQVLGAEPSLRSAGIDITVDRGEIWLHGNVTRRAHKRLAEDLAYRVVGVLDVHNRLRVDTSQLLRPGRSG